MSKIDQAAAALSVLDPTDRDLWIRMAGALNHEFGDAAYHVWESWSRRDTRPPPHGFHERTARSQWNSMRRRGYGPTIEIGSLFHAAKLAGWTPETPIDTRPRQPSAEEQRETERRAEYMERQAQQSATEAQAMLDASEYREHQYLATKGFPAVKGNVLPAYNGRFGFNWTGYLVVPMRNAWTDQVQSAQLITPGGAKRFLAYGKAGEAVFRIGPRRTAATWYVEGLATGLSVRSALRAARRDDQVVVCFSAHNITAVTRKHARGPSFVVADNDPSAEERAGTSRRQGCDGLGAALVDAARRGHGRQRPSADGPWGATAPPCPAPARAEREGG